MSQPIRIEMLGGLKVRIGECEMSRFRTQKAASLLAYLALKPGRRHSRDEVAELLWPDSDPNTSRNRLSTTLWELRKDLNDGSGSEFRPIIADRISVGLSEELVSSDVLEFEHLLADSSPDSPDNQRAERLQRALRLYGGPFLRGYYDDWIFPEQARLSDLFVQAARDFARLREKEDQRSSAVEYLRRAATAEPLREDVRRSLMRLLVADGRPAEALTEYRSLERQIREQLDSAPAEETRQLFEAIRASAAARCSNSPRPPLPNNGVTAKSDAAEWPAADLVSQQGANESANIRGIRTDARLPVNIAKIAIPSIVLFCALAFAAHRTPANLTSRTAHPGAPHVNAHPVLAYISVARTDPQPVERQPPALPAPMTRLDRESVFKPVGAVSALQPQIPNRDPQPSWSEGSALVSIRPDKDFHALQVNVPHSTPREGSGLWSYHYTPEPDERDGDVADLGTDAAGNVFVAGFVKTTRNDVDILTLKLSPAGKLLWRRRYNNARANDCDRAGGLAVDNKGDVYIIGETYAGDRAAGGTEWDIVTLKYDGAGNLKWVQQYDSGSGGDDRAPLIGVDAEDNAYAVCTSRSPGGKHAEFALIKYDPAGHCLWTDRSSHMGGGLDASVCVANSMAVTPSGNIFLTGETGDESGSGPAFSGITLRLDRNGNVVWVATVASGSGIDTSAVGSFAFTLTAADKAGNSASASTSYAVGYGINPLYDQTKAVKSGACYPIKLQIVDANSVNYSSSSVALQAKGVTRLSDNAPGALESVGNANPDNNFRFDSTSQSYIFNLSTSGYTTGTYSLSFTAGADPAVHSVQFQVK